MKKGFTLLELLIVIGILAILSTTMILVINPAEMLKKARDSQRISDLNTLKTAIAYYITNTASPSIGSTSATYSDVASVACFGTATGTHTFGVDGTGWVPINFATLTGGSPIGSLPRDPNPEASTGNHYYAYGVASATDYTFKLVTNMESTYYGYNGTGDVEQYDGGTNNALYEVGTGMSLTITTTSNCFTDGGP